MNQDPVWPTTRQRQPSLLSYTRHKQHHHYHQQQQQQSPQQQPLLGPTVATTSNTQSDFLRRVELMNVPPNSNANPNNPCQSSSNRYRLWNPDQESDLWNEVLNDQEEDESLAYFAQGVLDVSAQSLDVEHHQQQQQLQQHESGKVSPDNSFNAVAIKRKRTPNKRYLDDVDHEDVVVASSDNRMKCPTCHYKGDKAQFGKHLISHYHHSHSKATRNDLIFEHIESIVKLSPFRCDLCDSFYCNWDHDFIAHWKAKHLKDDEPKGGFYWCSFCEFTCGAAEEMLGHLLGKKHEEIVDAIGRVVPIVIKKFNPFECGQCHKIFRLKFALIKHLKNVHSLTMKCDFCEDNSFLNDESLNAHVMKAHLRNDSTQCDLCRKRFDTSQQLESHSINGKCRMKGIEERTKINEEELSPLKCDFCDENSFLNDESLNDHVMKVHRWNDSNHCDLSRKRFDTSQQLESHSINGKCRIKEVININEEEFPPLKCDFCGENSFANEETLKDHLIRNHWTDLSQCGLCGDRFVKPQQLGVHARNGDCLPKGIQTPNSDRNLLKCPEEKCKFQSDSLNRLLYHQSLRHFKRNSRPEKYKCHVCQKELKKCRLWDHMTIHGEAHRCDQCYRVFHTAQKLASHIKKSHKGILIKLGKSDVLSCSQCDYSTNKERLLALHKKRTHFKAKQCEKCGKVSNTFKKYRDHLKFHEKPAKMFSCQHQNCFYKCNSKSDLLSHAKTHQILTRFKCGKCDFSCKRTSELTRHNKRVHETGGDGVRFKCSECRHYRTDSKQHLDRHKATCSMGTNKKGFKCRLCDFAAGTEEGIRKHILKTQKHAGEKVYVCDFCHFETDSGIEFGFHLSDSHENHFHNNPNEAKKHVKQYFHVKK